VLEGVDRGLEGLAGDEAVRGGGVNGGDAALRGERMRRQQEGEWDQEESGRLGGALIDGAGGRWARKPAAGRRRQSSDKAGDRRWSGGLNCDLQKV